jgi:hypothetical protein
MIVIIKPSLLTHHIQTGVPEDPGYLFCREFRGQPPFGNGRGGTANMVNTWYRVKKGGGPYLSLKLANMKAKYFLTDKLEGDK